MRIVLLYIILFFCWVSFASAQSVDVIFVPEGEFIQGSDRAEREYGYKLDEKAYGHSVTRDSKWYEDEVPRVKVHLQSYKILKFLVTNEDYARFVAETGHQPPFVDKKTWDGYGLIHPYSRATGFFWKNGKPPEGRDKHPVVAVSYFDALAYAAWLSKKTGHKWRLPTEREWEKAARGSEGWYFPWGNKFDRTKLNSHDKGPFRTVAVGSFKSGVSQYGLDDGAGQVFEWVQAEASAKRAFVKGGSWDDKGCGVCRAAARHRRPKTIRHILVGFRLVRE